MRHAVFFAFAVSTCFGDDSGRILRLDHYVRVKSTVPAMAGETAQIYVREVVQARPGKQVVLFVHGAGTPAEVAQLMKGLRALPGYVFWPDNISLLDTEMIDTERLLSSGQVTDSYLLALACAHKGQLATFDRRLVTNAVRGGAQGLHLIG